MDRLQQMLQRSSRDAAIGCAVLFIDLDGFRLVNDSLSHSIGDQLDADMRCQGHRRGRGLAMSEGTVRFDTRGIVVLHGLRQRLREHQTTLVLVIPQDGRIRRAIELVRLADFMPIKEGLEEALHAVG